MGFCRVSGCHLIRHHHRSQLDNGSDRYRHGGLMNMVNI